MTRPKEHIESGAIRPVRRSSLFPLSGDCGGVPRSLFTARHAHSQEALRMRSEAVEAMKAAPPVGYIAGTIAGLSWSEWASIAALIYTLWLLAEKVWKLVGPRWKAWQASR